MDIEEFSELKSDLTYEKDENSIYYKKYKITSLEEFLKLIYLHREQMDDTKKDIYYRGQGDSNWEVDASIFRKKILHNEDEILHSLEVIRPNDFKECTTNLERLTVMQHYGAPTRLVDITANPLIALYFACEDTEKESDAIVYLFEEELRENKDYINIVSTLAFFENNKTIEEFASYLKNKNYYYSFSKIGNALNKKRLLIKPKKNSERIIAQQGYFFLLSNNQGGEEEDIIRKRSFSIESNLIILIEKTSKKKILDQLEIIGIKKSTIYPELVSHVDELVTKYKETDKSEDTDSTDLDLIVKLTETPIKKDKLINEFIEFLTPELKKIVIPLLKVDWEKQSHSQANIRKEIKRYSKNKHIDVEKELECFKLLLEQIKDN